MSLQSLTFYSCFCLLSVLVFGAVIKNDWEQDMNDDDVDGTKLSWHEWKGIHGKNYDGDDDAMRHAIWSKNKMIVEEHNARKDSTFKLGLNSFADMDASEPKSKNPLLNPDVQSRASGLPSSIPSSFDWRTKGVVPFVSSQGTMGSSAVIDVQESIVSLNTIHTGRLVATSLEEVYQCCYKAPIRSGPSSIYDCVINKLGGLCKEADYPSSGNGSCMADRCKATVMVKGYNFINDKNETRLAIELLENPVLITIDASHPSFQMYRSGVYDEKDCGKTLDHTMLLVGYGVQKINGAEVDYWVCQNSWGVNWGMQGYMLIARNQGNMCGIASAAFRPYL